MARERIRAALPTDSRWDDGARVVQGETSQTSPAAARGNLANVRFDDFLRLVEALGFELLRISGSHRVYRRSDVGELLSLQPHRGHAKPYQIRQLLVLLRVYNLSLRERS